MRRLLLACSSTVPVLAAFTALLTACGGGAPPSEVSAPLGLHDGKLNGLLVYEPAPASDPTATSGALPASRWLRFFSNGRVFVGPIDDVAEQSQCAASRGASFDPQAERGCTSYRLNGAEIHIGGKGPYAFSAQAAQAVTLGTVAWRWIPPSPAGSSVEGVFHTANGCVAAEADTVCLGTVLTLSPSGTYSSAEAPSGAEAEAGLVPPPQQQASHGQYFVEGYLIHLSQAVSDGGGSLSPSPSGGGSQGLPSASSAVLFARLSDSTLLLGSQLYRRAERSAQGVP